MLWTEWEKNKVDSCIGNHSPRVGSTPFTSFHFDKGEKQIRAADFGFVGSYLTFTSERNVYIILNCWLLSLCSV